MATDAQLRAAGFSDEEIKLHNAGFSAAEIAAHKAPPKGETLGSTLARAAWNTPRDALDTLKGMEIFTPQGQTKKLIEDLSHPIKTFQGYSDAVTGVVDKVKGGLQRVRELSPVALRGDAPAMDTSAFDQYASSLKQKYGTKQGIYKEIGDHPVGTAIAVGSVAVPALKATGATDALGGVAERAAAALGSKAEPAVRAVKTITEAERRGNTAAGIMSDQAKTALAADQSAAQAEAAAAQARAARFEALKAKAQARGKVLSERATEASKRAVPPELNVGEERPLTEVGSPVREAALVRQSELDAGMKEAYAKHREAMEAVAADRAASGAGISDTDTGKAIINRLQSVVEPDPATRPAVGKVPLDDAGGKLYRKALDVLRPHTETLPNGSKRVIKAGLKDVDDLRRFVGELLNGPVEGYGAINKAEARKLYAELTQAMDEYVAGAHEPAQAAWRAGKEALEPYERVRMGKAIVGTQPGTSVSAVPAANIPRRIIAGGQDTVRQAAAVAGDEPVRTAVASQAQAALKGAETSRAAEAAIAQSKPLGDAMRAYPDLVKAASEYVQGLKDAEAAGTQAKDLTQRAGTSSDRAERFEKEALALQGQSQAAANLAAKHATNLKSLEFTAPQDVGPKYESMLYEARKAGRINDAQLTKGLQLVRTAQKDFAIKATRDKWLKAAAGALGFGAMSKLGFDAVQVYGGH